jgi:hypothetical protein
MARQPSCRRGVGCAVDPEVDKKAALFARAKGNPNILRLILNRQDLLDAFTLRLSTYPVACRMMIHLA